VLPQSNFYLLFFVFAFHYLDLGSFEITKIQELLGSNGHCFVMTYWRPCCPRSTDYWQKCWC